MKKFLLTILASITLVGAAFADSKIYTFDLQKTVAAYEELQNEMKILRIQRENLKVEETQKQTELQPLMNEYSALIKDYQNSETLSEDARKELAAKIQEKEAVIKTKSSESNEYLKNKAEDFNKATKTVEEKYVEKIRSAVKNIGQTKKADLILNAEENSAVVFYSIEYIDITKEVIDALNKK